MLLFNTIVTACFFQLLLLNGYIKHSGYFGYFLAAYCVTLLQGPLLSGPIVGLKGRPYKGERKMGPRAGVNVMMKRNILSVKVK
jgi:hypothetical protein